MCPPEEKVPQWLAWAREVQALAQTGKSYSQNEWQTQRYDRLSEIAAEMIETYTRLPAAEIEEGFKAQPGYATPKVDVRAAVFNEAGELLLVQERRDDSWNMPGGWADVGDVPSQAAERETREEARLEVKEKMVLGVYDANRSEPMALYHAFKLIYLCELIGGEAGPSDETKDARFFSKDTLPYDLLSRRTTARQVEDAFRAYQTPNTPTAFD